MTDLEERLEKLHGRRTVGDWGNVVHRATRQRRRRQIRTTLALVVALVVLGIPALAVADQVGVIHLTASDDQVPPSATAPALPYVLGNVLTMPGRPPIELAGSLNFSYTGMDSPIAIPSPDGQSVIYHAWESEPVLERGVGTPILRLVDLHTGKDALFERGSSTAAWRADGTLAYTKALRPLYTGVAGGELTGWYGHVLVRAGLDAPAQRWTAKPSQYRIWAWAKRSLIVGEQEPRGSDQPVSLEPRRLLSLGGTGEAKELPLNGFIAVSPDGALVAGTVEDAIGLVRLIRIVDISSGRVVAELDPGRSQSLARDRTHTGVRFTPGSWSQRAIAAVKQNPYWGNSALVILHFDGKRLAPEQELTLDREILGRAGVRSFEGQSFVEPLFLGNDERELSVRIMVSGVKGATGSVLTCDLPTERCRAGRTYDANKGLVFAVNPSRPLLDPGP